MTPWQAVRLWSRRAPLPERVGSLAGGLAAVALIIWLLAPTGARHALSNSSSAQAGSAAVAGPGASLATPAPTIASGTPGTPGAPGQAAGSRGAVGSGRAFGAAGATTTLPGQPGAGGGGGTSAAATRCTNPPAGTPGMTASTMKVWVTLSNIAGAAANTTFGIASPTQQQAGYTAMINAVNAAGGIDCRRLEPVYTTVDPADSSSLQQACLDAVQSGVFAALDYGAYADYPQKDCYAQNHIPYFSYYVTTVGEEKQYFPYLFETDTLDGIYRNAVYGLKQRGFFDPAHGFSKLGFIYQSCHPDLIAEFDGWLHDVGVPAAQIVAYDVGCPSDLASPSDMEQAILRFQQNGVSNVTAADFVGNWAAFTAIAQQQGFKPHYGLGDDGVVAISYGSEKPNASNFDGAVAVTPGGWGQEHTPGLATTPGTAACDAIMQGAGQPPVYQEVQAYGGYICDELWVFKAAVEHAPVPAQGALGAGLEGAGTIDFSFPLGPYSTPAGQVPVDQASWRVDQYSAGCACWTVVDPVFHPSF